MHRTRVNFTLRGRALCAALPMCAVPLCACAACLKTTSNSLQMRACTLTLTLQCFSLPWCSQWLCFLWKLVYKGFEVMGLIFASPKPILLMFCFDTFHWFNATLNFTFPFEFLAKMMKFFGTFAGVAWHGAWPRKPWLHLNKSTRDFLENYHKWNTIWLFFKIEFWRIVVICQHAMKIFES